MKVRMLQLLGSIGLLLVLIGSVFAYQVSTYLNNPVAPNQDQPSKIVYIPKGSSFQKILKILENEEVLERPRWFQVLAAWRKLDSKIKAGEYLVETQWTPDQMLNHLVSGKTQLYKVTIPEGLTFQETAERLVKAGFGQLNRYLELKENTELLTQIDISPLPPSLEGFLFPETYFFPKRASEFEIFEAMIQQFNKHYLNSYKIAAQEWELSDFEVLILASMIEKETGQDADRPLIAAVFHNRLKRNMRLESDPTVIYGLEDFDGNLTRKHLRSWTAYNTYTNFGLPPGPICNPGKASIESALAPADVKYLYFVAKGDGASHFSTNLKAHNRAVWKYQKNRKNRSKNRKDG